MREEGSAMRRCPKCGEEHESREVDRKMVCEGEKGKDIDSEGKIA